MGGCILMLQDLVPSVTSHLTFIATQHASFKDLLVDCLSEYVYNAYS